MTVDALVLAGGPLERERFTGLDPAIERKAQIPILGRPMVEWTVRALRDHPRVGRIVVVGHPTLETPELRGLDAAVVPERGEIGANLRAGLDALPGSEKLLVCSGDLPLLTPEELDDLFTHAPEADVVFPVVERAEIERDFPGRVWVYSKLADGHYTGCSGALVRPARLLENWGWVEEILNARRKSPLGLAAMFGWGLVFKLLLGRLRIADVEQRGSALLHLTGRGYRMKHTGLAMDVDKFTDIALAEEKLCGRSSGVS